eukprot:1139793-Pelagomonas_calceolata.AAC.3
MAAHEYANPTECANTSDVDLRSPHNLWKTNPLIPSPSHPSPPRMHATRMHVQPEKFDPERWMKAEGDFKSLPANGSTSCPFSKQATYAGVQDL